MNLLRAYVQIDQGTWVVAEISHCPSSDKFRRLPSGCLIQSIAKGLSKVGLYTHTYIVYTHSPITLCRYQQVTWVEHTEVEESLPNQTFYDHLIRSGFAFGAERMVAWLERSCERGSVVNATSDMHTKAPGFEGKGTYIYH